MRTLHAFLSLVIVTLVCISGLHAAPGGDAPRVEPVIAEPAATEGQVVLEMLCEPGEPEQVRVSGRTYHILDPENHMLTSDPGIPMLPYRMQTVCIPAGAEVTFELDVLERSSLEGVRLLPGPDSAAPLTGSQAFRPEQSYRLLEDAGAYSQQLPASPVDLNDRGFIGRQEVVRVRYYPVEFDPTVNRVDVITRAILTITYTGGSPYRHRETGPIRELLESSSVNYDQMLKLPLKEPERAPEVLPMSGQTWYKVTINTSGIYGVTQSELAAAGVPTS